MFSTRLKELRNECGLSQKELAKKIFVSQQTVAKWETEKSTPDPNMLVLLAELFDVTTDYLTGKSENKNTNLDEQLEDIEFALFGEVKELTDEQKRDILNYAKFVKSQGRNVK